MTEDSSSTLWRRTSRALDELAALAGAARADFLAELERREPDVHREVVELAALESASDDFLVAPVARAAEGVARELGLAATGGEGGGQLDTHPSVAGRVASGATVRIGDWRLVQLLGRGGMGEVYLARRAEGGFEQEAALKLLRRGVDSEEVLARFLRERQILARLDHPGIARLLDGGVAADDRPYFVLERVAGEPIVAFAEARALPIAERLRLFLDACRAVAAAHRALVVHRDLKPSNVLVTADGAVKLLDFGIAKLLEDDGDAGATRTELRLMTPAYAAPEQIVGGAITTATDVFALGALLFELATGRRAFERRGRTPTELLRELDAEEAIAPRSRLRTELARTDGEPERSALRARLESLPADLDAIVLQALERDPARRYATVGALAADVERLLAGHPVAARAQTATYRARKFVARHRVGVAAAALVVLSLAVGLLAAVREARRANREAQRSERVQRFLVELFERADPTRTLGERVTALAVADQGAERIERELADEPEIASELRESLARLYRSVGRLDRALALARAARSELEARLGRDAPETLRARLTEAEIRGERGDLVVARAELEEIVPRIHAQFGSESAEAVRAGSALAFVVGQAGEGGRAVELERALLDVAGRLWGAGSVELAERRISFASTLGEEARYEESEAELRRAIEELERAGAARSPQRIVAETELADLLDRAGKDEESERLFPHVLALGIEVLGPDHPQVAQIELKRGAFLVERRRLGEAEQALVRALAILEPLDHYDAIAGLRYLGQARFADERYGEALEAFVAAERRAAERLGAEHPLTRSARVSRAWAETRTGELAASEAALRAAIATEEGEAGSRSETLRAPLRYLGENLREQRRFDEAIEVHRRELELERELFGVTNLAIAVTVHQLALDLLGRNAPGDLVEARALVDEALGFLRSREPEPARLGEALTTAGRISTALGERARAERELDEALVLLTGARPAGSPLLGRARAARAELERSR